MNIISAVWGLAIITAVIILLALTVSPTLWRYRRVGGEITAGLLIAAMPLIATFSWPASLSLSMAIIQLWLIILSCRLVLGRLESHFLRVSSRYNTLLATLVISLLIGGQLLFDPYEAFVHAGTALGLLLTVSLVLASGALRQAVWTLRHFALNLNDASIKQLPTVSICIPARNETHSLTECLMAVLASDYPKLEVLVLDDCSQDKTSQIIRSFAHDGVRFVQGDTPAEGWLGKNQAMKTLAEHASGDLILFMDVDTLLAPRSISQLVQYMRGHNLDMLSVLPQQRQHIATSTLLAPLQYYWRIVLPITKRRVPVSSKAWLIKATTLQKLGGFDSVRHKIVPEGSFARRLHDDDMYRFIVSDAELGLTTAKSWRAHLNTAVRITYPSLKRQPLYALGIVLSIVMLICAPFAILFTLAFMGDYNEAFWFAFGACAVWLLSYGLVLARTSPHSWMLSTLLLPYTALQEAMLTIWSMLQYEFGEIDWKGRNVCYPVIAVSPRAFRPHSSRDFDQQNTL